MFTCCEFTKAAKRTFPRLFSNLSTAWILCAQSEAHKSNIFSWSVFEKPNIQSCFPAWFEDKLQHCARVEPKLIIKSLLCNTSKRWIPEKKHKKKKHTPNHLAYQTWVCKTLADECHGENLSAILFLFTCTVLVAELVMFVSLFCCPSQR